LFVKTVTNYDYVKLLNLDLLGLAM